MDQGPTLHWRRHATRSAQKVLLMATHAEKAQKRCTRAFDNALKALNTAANDIERQFTAPLEQGTHSELCKEIRAHIRSLDKDKRDGGSDVLERRCR